MRARIGEAFLVARVYAAAETPASIPAARVAHVYEALLVAHVYVDDRDAGIYGAGTLVARIYDRRRVGLDREQGGEHRKPLARGQPLIVVGPPSAGRPAA